MNSVELNKIACVALFTSLFIFGLNILSGMIYSPSYPKTPAYSVEVAETTSPKGGGGDAAGGAGEPDIATLLASANTEKGAKVAKKCAACHTFDAGGKNGTGPNLYGVVGNDLGAVGGFGYSSALKEKGGKWDFAALNEFFKKPKKYIPGTKMAFAGLKKPTDRANLIAYLNSKSDSPLPLPAAPEAAPAGQEMEKDVAPNPSEEPAQKPQEPADKQSRLAPQGGTAPANKIEAEKGEITGSIARNDNPLKTTAADAPEQKKNNL